MPLEFTHPGIRRRNPSSLDSQRHLCRNSRHRRPSPRVVGTALYVRDPGSPGPSDPDTLIIDYSEGGFGVPIQFDGGAPDSGDGDTLQLIGGSTETITHVIEDPSSGTVALAGGGLDHVVTYSGLEPIIDNLAAVDRVFTFVGGAESIVLEDDINPVDGVNRIDSTLGEQIDFASPTGSVTINAGSGSDVIDLQRLDSATSFASLVVNGDAESDSIQLNDLLPGMTAQIFGGAADDSITIGDGVEGLTNILGEVFVNQNPSPAASETASGAVASTNVTETVTAKSLSVTVTLPVGDQLNVNDQAGVLPNTYTLDDTTLTRTGSPAISYALIDTLNIETGSAGDVFNVLDTAPSTTVDIRTFGGEDTITVTDSGEDGILRIDSGVDDDSVTIETSGARSVLLLATDVGQDDVSVTTTGVESGLDIQTGSEIDLLTLANTGASSATFVDLGAADDVANLRATGFMSATEIFGDLGNDTFNISSDADGDRVDADGSTTGDLDGLLGDVCIHGNANLAVPTTSESVTANGETVTATTIDGDQLNLVDAASIGGETYTLDVDQFTRTGIATVNFLTLESVSLETSGGEDFVNLVDTAADSRTTLQTRGGVANLSIADTGDRSILIVDTRLENDVVSVTNTGDDSLVRINTAAGDDDINVTATGTSSGLDLRSGNNLDVVQVDATGAMSVTAARLGPGDDVLNVQTVGTTSDTEVFLASGNDVVNLTSSADGNRINPNGTLTGDLNGFLGEVLVHGNQNFIIPDSSASVTAKTLTRMATTLTGDVLNISDQANVAGSTYGLDATQFTRTGIGPIAYTTIETFNIETGTGNDVFDVSATADRTRVTIATMAGEDTVTVLATGADGIVQLDTGADNDSVTLTTTGDRSITEVVTDAGEDDVAVTMTGVDSGLEVNTGDDIDLVGVFGTGTGSATLILLGEGDDIANIRSTSAASFTDVVGDGGNDTTNVSSDADGDRLDPSGDPAGTLDGILGEVCFRGDDELAAPDATESVSAGSLTVTTTLPRGDALNVSDEGNAVAGTYTLEMDSVTKMGFAPITYQSVETLVLETGTSDDVVDVTNTPVSTSVQIVTGMGEDTLSIMDSGNDGFLQIDTGSEGDSVSISRTGDRSVTRVSTDAGADDVDVSASGTDSGIELLTGTEIDLVTIICDWRHLGNRDPAG